MTRETACSPRTPVLACADALREAGARVETVIAGSDAEIDAVVARFDGDSRADGLAWPAVPLHTGKPWFLPVVGAYYRMKDLLP